MLVCTCKQESKQAGKDIIQLKELNNATQFLNGYKILEAIQ